MSEDCSKPCQNTGDNVFQSVPIDSEVARLFGEYLLASDFVKNTRRAVVNDVRKFAKWFADANQEPLTLNRVTTRDIGDFRDSLRRQNLQAVSTVNRALVSVRQFLKWLHENGYSLSNPGKGVKELRKQELAPAGLERSQVRRLLREVELRQDIRSNAIFHFCLYTGCRVSEVVSLSNADLMISERSGSAIFRNAKGNKQRSVPVPVPARKAISEYCAVRPPSNQDFVFIGERGPLTEKGIRASCEKYGAICGFHLHPHLLRHTFAHRFLKNNPGDLVALAQILGHENLNTTRRYVAKTQQQLAEASDRITY